VIDRGLGRRCAGTGDLKMGTVMATLIGSF
jgi:hypothetical protein